MALKSSSLRHFCCSFRLPDAVSFFFSSFGGVSPSLAQCGGQPAHLIISNFALTLMRNCWRRLRPNHHVEKSIFTGVCGTAAMAETVKSNGSTAAAKSKPAMSKPGRPRARESFPEPPLMKAVLTHLEYGILIILGHVWDFLRRLGLKRDPYTEALKNEASFILICRCIDRLQHLSCQCNSTLRLSLE